MSLTADRTVPIDTSDNPGFLRWKWPFTFLAVVLLVISVAMMFGTKEGGQYMLNSWIYGYGFWLLLTMGALGLSILHNSIKSSWTLPVLRIFEAGSSWQMFLVFFLCLIPVMLNLGAVYEWAHVEEVQKDTVLQHKQGFLNPQAYVIGMSFVFLLFAGLSAGLRASTQRQDKSMDPAETQLRVNWASPGLVMFFIGVTAIMTWFGMSLNPHWVSTIYGIWTIVGGAQAALSLAVVLVCTNANKRPYRDVMSPFLTKDLGNMLFVLTMLWGYTSVSQLIIIWNGNVPEFASFYAHRGGDKGLFWNVIGASTLVGCFIVPFVTLLSPRIKRYPERLARIAGWIFFFRILDVFWILAASVPHRQHAEALPTLQDFLSFVTMGCVWLAVMLHQVEKASLLPRYDRRLQEMKEHAH